MTVQQSPHSSPHTSIHVHRRAAALRTLVAASALSAAAGFAIAQPALVSHNPTTQVFNQPGGTTGREPDVVREDQAVDLWLKIGPSFSYNRVFIYYTIDGTPPAGANGVAGTPSTIVMASFPRSFPTIPQQVFFQYNQPNPFGGNDDWWKATVPLVGVSPAASRDAGVTVRYLVSAQQNNGGEEIFANNGQPFSYTVKLPWPGAGAGSATPGVGYPNVNFWKEEAFIGNTFTAAMLDQNGSWWDMYFPTPGGVQGVGTRNEGYSDGADTFPALLSPEKRGQMHLNIATVGIRTPFDATTHWLTNPGGVSYSNVQQQYLSDETNTIRTTQTLTANGNNISITQHDFAPAGIDFPDGLANTGEQKHMLIKRMTLRNNTQSAQDVDLYMYLDPAINGGDTYDVMFWDAARGAMTVYDKTRRNVTGTGSFISPPNEYNITTFSSYEKNIALYLTAAMEVQGPGGGLASDAWADTSADQSQGWIARRVTLPPGVDVDVAFMLAGAHFRPEPITGTIPANDGVYDNEIVPMLDWFYAQNHASVQNATDAYWGSWLDNGVTIDFPNNDFDRLFKRGLLASALHQDGVNGGIVAGYHNGAYYYVWPRDAMWAAVTLARAGHIPEARKAVDWMRDVSYRDFEAWGRKGFWKQKCTTDGFTVWGAPQIDGTAVFPWAVKWIDDLTGDTSFLTQNYPAVRDSVLAMTQDSSDSRLRWEEAFNLTYSNNLWEDSYDTFIYSNANMHRGLTDAADIASILGFAADAADATTRAGWVKSGIDARLDWDGENTDISQLGIVYPFEVYSPTDFRSVRVIDRINGVRTKFNNTHPTAETLVNFAGFFNDGYGWTDLINRYWGDGYWGNGSASTPWGAGPWFLTTMWYGMYYALRQDFTPGTSDIDNHTYRLELLVDRLGPVGLGAEQIAPRGIPGQPFPFNTGSLLYPGQNDFMLQTAWPNAWESMSFFVDSLMGYLDYQPDARANVMKIEPKLPGAWPSMTFNNVELRANPLVPSHQIDITVAKDDALGEYTHLFTNRVGMPLTIDTVVRVPANFPVASVTKNGVDVPFTYDAPLGRVRVVTELEQGSNATTLIRVAQAPACPLCPADFDNDGGVTGADVEAFFASFESGDPCADTDLDGGVTGADVEAFFATFEAGGC
jgi:GH15 family glucan-1,4-alpha-glucosidase